MSKQTGQIWEWKGDVHGERFRVKWNVSHGPDTYPEYIAWKVTCPVYGLVASGSLGKEDEVDVNRRRNGLATARWRAVEAAISLAVGTAANMLNLVCDPEWNLDAEDVK